MPRYLTKSRFKLAVECPTKLFYTDKYTEYADMQMDDPFLRALADGGFQVGELAKMMFPGGIEVIARTHDAQVAETRELLARDEVTIFEAAIHDGDFFARIDILRKSGNRIELIEVKAKSFDSTKTTDFRQQKGGIAAAWLPYLQDVAFQTHVFRQAFPGLSTSSFLMLANKSKACTVDGLNQRFKISRVDGRPLVSISPGTDAGTIGAPILSRICVDHAVAEILAGRLKAPGEQGSWAENLARWADAYRQDQKLGPTIGGHCAKCQFHDPSGVTGLRSGRQECWRDPLNARGAELRDGTVLDLWNFRGKQQLIDEGVVRLADVSKDDLRFEEGDDGLSASERQWMQISGEWPGGGPFFLDRELMLWAMEKWEFPLHFIDFETASVAIPFFKGHRPYEMVAFQFSHHVVDEEGFVAHQNEYLNTSPGENPNYEFIRHLCTALGHRGTVFMWSPHENTTLNAILRQLQEDPQKPADAGDLEAFILSLTIRREGVRIVHTGARAMVDLCRLAEKAFFHPAAKGSSSIKKVLPAVLESSRFLKIRYFPAIYGADGGIRSQNFRDWSWWREDTGKPVDPYRLLPPVFSDLPAELQAKLDSDTDMEITQGGAATMAYARLQFEELSSANRSSIEAALRRYCELDTLAMVMIYEAWREWSS
jgi:hypothetical protein